MVVNMYSSLNKREKMVYESIMKNVPGATNDADVYYIDFEDRSYLSVDDIREIIKLYDSIDDEIERYIEDNDLDDVLDEKEIKSHFEEYDEKGFFYTNQAVLRPVEVFALDVYDKFTVERKVYGRDYYTGNEIEIKIGEMYYFDEIWDGNGDEKEILKDGTVSPDNENVVAFSIIDKDDEDITLTLVRVTDIY